MHTAAENEPKFPTTSKLHCFCLERDLPTHTAIPVTPLRGGVPSSPLRRSQFPTPSPAPVFFLLPLQGPRVPTALPTTQQAGAGAGRSCRGDTGATGMSRSPLRARHPGQPVSQHQDWAGRQALPPGASYLLQTIVFLRDPWPLICPPCPRMPSLGLSAQEEALLEGPPGGWGSGALWTGPGLSTDPPWRGPV